MEARARKRARIQDVIDAEAVSIVFQPIVQLRTGDTVAYEALSRFPGEPTQSPALWFAEAFEVGLGEELELLALRGALQALDQLPSACSLCVNISPATARSDGFATLLAKYPIERLFVEITEHASIDDYESLHAALERAGGGRIRLAVDDAGAGYASLNHILQLHPRAIKLDISLVRGIDTDPVKRALAWSLMVFGREIDAVIVAEGIETAGELVCLRELGIGWGQGYHLGRPGPLPA
jgi:EAL domain-containing protein (putative c-di-GMP-specific phosphodiesterase class I)